MWVWIALAGACGTEADSAPGADSDASGAPHDSPAPDDSSAPFDSDSPTGETGGADSEAPFSDEPLPICINEFMPENDSALRTEGGDTPDWIELHNPGKKAVSLEGWHITDDADDPERGTFDASSILAAGEFLLIYADGEPELGIDHVDFALDSSGGAVGLFAPDGRGQVVHYGEVGADFSVYRTTDCCTEASCLDFDFRGTPGASNTHTESVWTEVLSLGSSWRYHAAETPPDGSWSEEGYDAAAWSTGTAPLGFGDTHQVTVIDGGAADARWPTLYFRTVFDVGVAETVRDLRLSLMVDDGAVVWLNGVEVLRANLPEGYIAFDTWAVTEIGDADEYTAYSYTADPASLVSGPNTLAVEVHQATSTSSDLTFDLGVSVEREE